jgi:hypothetical protein
METDRQILARHFQTEIDFVQKTSKKDDMRGSDYTVVCLDGSGYAVDMKRRENGASRYWANPNVPEMAVELGTDNRPGPLFRGRLRPAADRWCLLYADLPGQVFMLPVPQLVEAARSNIRDWVDRYGVRTSKTWNQDGSYSCTHVCFVPVPVVEAAIRAVKPWAI